MSLSATMRSLLVALILSTTWAHVGLHQHEHQPAEDSKVMGSRSCENCSHGKYGRRYGLKYGEYKKYGGSGGSRNDQRCNSYDHDNYGYDEYKS